MAANKNYFILLALYLGGLVVRMVYEALKKQGRVDLDSRPVFLIILVDMCTLWASWFTMCKMDPWPLGLPPLIRGGGLLLFSVGMGLAILALVQLRRLENTKALVTSGVFRLVRHPMYLGFMLWLVGWPLFHDAGLSLIPGLFGLGCVLSWRSNEEQSLLAQFGQAYESYRSRTWW